MSAILANAVRARNDRYINRLGENMGKYRAAVSQKGEAGGVHQDA